MKFFSSKKIILSSLIVATIVSLFLVILCPASILAASSSTDSPSSPSTSSSSSNSKSSNNNNNNNHHHHHHSTTATQSRASTAASVIGALSSLVPGLITNVAPLVLLFGLGALMMPTLGMGAMGLLRESRRSSNDQINGIPNGALPAAFAQYARPLQTSPQDIYYFTKRSFPSLMSNINTVGLMNGFQDILERVARAIDNADKRYN